MKTLRISSSKNKQTIDITQEVQNLIDKENTSGIINLFLKHTSAGLSLADLDPGTGNDYLIAANNMVPDISYNHPHDPSHFPDHFLSTVIGTSLSIPVKNGQLVLGTWQRIVILEFNGPKEREIVVTFIKE